MDEFLKSLHPVTAVLHWKVLEVLKRYDVRSVLDVGGVGKLGKLTNYGVTDVNISTGTDGCNMSFKDDSFDATVSIATLEHVGDQEKFLQECHRVAKKVDIHWFPYGPFAKEVEGLKKKYGHQHPCRLSLDLYHWTMVDGGIPYKSEGFIRCGEHLLLCMTLTPSLKAPEVYDYALENHDEYYGILLIGEK